MQHNVTTSSHGINTGSIRPKPIQFAERQAGEPLQGAFDKYRTTGAYHWAEGSPLNWRYNAPLIARYRSVLRRIPAGATRILDVGCGDGYLTYLIAKRNPRARIIGIDDEESGIRQANAMTARTGLSNLEFRHVAAGAMPFHDAEFPLVVLADVIEHVPQVPAMLRELKRIIARGGALIVTTPNRQPGSLWDPRHVKEYTPAELRSELAAFFSVDAVFGSWPMHYFKMWRRKRAGRIVLDLAARSGWNVFDSEIGNPGENYGQLIAVART
jgi:2-polyprenyl-3-methyl-5-hydroxy-6-metoxy-1,4-benzoquinol methylase